MTDYIVETEEAEKFIHQALGAIDEKNYELSREYLNQAYVIFKDVDSSEGISICLSLMAFLDYSEDKTKYEQAASLMHDGMFMAQRSGSNTAVLINELSRIY